MKIKSEILPENYKILAPYKVQHIIKAIGRGNDTEYTFPHSTFKGSMGLVGALKRTRKYQDVWYTQNMVDSNGVCFNVFVVYGWRAKIDNTHLYQ